MFEFYVRPPWWTAIIHNPPRLEWTCLHGPVRQDKTRWYLSFSLRRLATQYRATIFLIPAFNSSLCACMATTRNLDYSVVLLFIKWVEQELRIFANILEHCLLFFSDLFLLHSLLKLIICILERCLCSYCSLPVLPAQHVTDGTPVHYNTSAHCRSKMLSDHSSDNPSNSRRRCDIKTASVYILAFIIIALSIALSLCLAEVTCSRGDTSMTLCNNTEEESSASKTSRRQ